VVIPVALAHMYGLGAAFLPAALAGGSVRLIPEANLLSYVRAEAEWEPTVAFLTPSFCHLLVKGRKQSRPYRLTVLAGDAAADTFAVYERRHGCTVNLYGSTELGAIAAGSPDETFLVRRDTVGRPMLGVRLGPPDGGEAGVGQPAGQPLPLRFDHPYGGLVAICTARPDATADAADAAALRRSALEHLPGHAVPDRFVFVDELPLTATAKPDRTALAAMARRRDDSLPPNGPGVGEAGAHRGSSTAGLDSP
jgi:acyl-CoA synthetase (AMP-forming)/AMP-acid ligase II